MLADHPDRFIFLNSESERPQVRDEPQVHQRMTARVSHPLLKLYPLG